MKLCRFNHNKMGIVQGERVLDITPLFDACEPPRWPAPPQDWMIANFAAVRPELAAYLPSAQTYPLDSVQLNSPIANPGKLIGAPINYQDHIAEANADQQINHGKVYTDISEFGLFLKANSSLIGPESAVEIHLPQRRTDPEVELAIVIGKTARDVSYEQALDVVLGYTIGLDMTVRGPEFPTFRKSADTFSVLGPWLVTADDIADPNALDLSLMVNGRLRQQSNTRHLIYNVQRLVAYASAMYTLYPGDVIYSGTPSGVASVEAGDRMEAHIAAIGTLTIDITHSTPATPPEKTSS